MKNRKPGATAALYIFVFVVCIVTLYPYFVTFVTAAKDTSEMYAANMTVFPKVWEWSNFVDLWSKAPVLRYLTNSVIIAGGATALAILCGVPAAYAMLKWIRQTALQSLYIRWISAVSRRTGRV